MNVLIATPTAGQIVTSAYVSSVVNATRVLHRRGLDYQHRTFDGADVVMARNFFANIALRDPTISAVLWLDSDMAIDVGIFERMFAFEGPMVAAIYSERAMDLEAYAGHRIAGLPDPQARALATRFNVRLETPGELTLTGGFCPVAGVGFGCVLTHRAVFDNLVSAGVVDRRPAGKLATVGLDGEIHDFFREHVRPDGSMLSEDYSFCHRVRAANMPIWALADTAIGHIGKAEYRASYVDHLQGRVALGKARTR